MTGNERSKVALVRCGSYDREEVEAAVAEAIELLGGFQEIFGAREETPGAAETVEAGDPIVLKPNLLAKASPDKAVTTHPEVFRAVGKALKEAGYGNLRYGDSPGNPMISPEKTAESCGLKAVADELGIRFGAFDHGRGVEYPQGKTSQGFVLCDEIADIVESGKGAVVNICKMKTHALERITGAVKNTFGCVYGTNKAASHARFESPEHFARMTADLNALVRARLHIMDGVIAMEGNGPGSGDPVPMYTILASTDPVALDATFCNLIHLDTELVPTNVAAAELGLGRMDARDICVLLGGVPMQEEGAEILMDEVAVKYGNKNFNVQRGRDFRGGFKVMKLFSGLLEKKPIVIEEKCIGCGICEETCPVEDKAIKLRPKITTAMAGSSLGAGAGVGLSLTEGIPKNMVAMYNYDRCIRCYCCQEMCPEKAISIQKSLLAKIIDRRWKV